MRIVGFGSFTVSIGVAGTLLAACGSQRPVSVPETTSQLQMTARPAWIPPLSDEQFHVLHSFTGEPDGNQPFAPLLYFHNAFYGTTFSGGENGSGTVFVVARRGHQERVLYSFGGSNGGTSPYAGLVAVGGTLYGTTLRGGNEGCQYYGCGTVYSITTSGMENVIHVFGASNDGAAPMAGLTWFHNAFYGTTSSGGEFGHGTVFKINRSGKEQVLYSFGARSGDGQSPWSGLAVLRGAFFGTTTFGGTGDCQQANYSGCGTVFRVDRFGHERIIHSFQDNNDDGRYPTGSLIVVQGTLFGTTSEGGPYNDGTAFSLMPGGKETILSNFGSDGYNVQAGLLDVGGTFYGTTLGGEYGFGTIYSLSSSGEVQTLHTFHGYEDGEYPYAPLIRVGDALYGTAREGGSDWLGTVFKISLRTRHGGAIITR